MRPIHFMPARELMRLTVTRGTAGWCGPETPWSWICISQVDKADAAGAMCCPSPGKERFSGKVA